MAQLAAILVRLAAEEDEDFRRFATLCFAAIVRGSSNADPVPVSGLEVTSHMLARELAGRVVDPWRLFSLRLHRSVAAMAEFAEARVEGCTVRVQQSDARALTSAGLDRPDAVITSPPYLTAIDYYRRHTLEMYWLGLTHGVEDRLALMSRYVGRDRVGARDLPELDERVGVVAARWLGRFDGVRPERERAFRHYCDGMARALSGMAEVVVPGGPIVIVVGDVRFFGKPVSMLELMNDLAGPRLSVADHLWYPMVAAIYSESRRAMAKRIGPGRKRGY